MESRETSFNIWKISEQIDEELATIYRCFACQRRPFGFVIGEIIEIHRIVST
jgi:hypothetical protein